MHKVKKEDLIREGWKPVKCYSCGIDTFHKSNDPDLKCGRCGKNIFKPKGNWLSLILMVLIATFMIPIYPIILLKKKSKDKKEVENGKGKNCSI